MKFFPLWLSELYHKPHHCATYRFLWLSVVVRKSPDNHTAKPAVMRLLASSGGSVVMWLSKIIRT